MKELPISEQDFSEIITKNLLYIDKTKVIYDIITKGKSYFLSRPRRFGKSLLLSTFKEIFGGHRELFKDLWLGCESDYDFMAYPIIYLDMALDSDSPEDLKISLLDVLQEIAESESLKISAPTVGRAITRLIKALAKKYGTKVVILIDEYDDPVSSHILNPSLALANRGVLRPFYSAIKSNSGDLRFLFVTGVTRFALMGFSGGQNQLDDISYDDKYADICGFTIDEFDKYLGSRLSHVLDKLKAKGRRVPGATVKELRQDILYWYDGYTWDGKTRLLNPVSVLKLLEKGEFSEYWLATSASLDFLRLVMANDPLDFTGDKLTDVQVLDVGWAEVGQLKSVPTLLQTGYLTIKDITYESKDKRKYQLTVPNFEVSASYNQIFSDGLFNFLKKNPKIETSVLSEAISRRDPEMLMTILNSLYCAVPAILHSDVESFYHSVLFGYCFNLTIKPDSEQPGGKGTPDLVLRMPDGQCAILELKYAKATNDIDQSPKKKKALMAKKAKEALEAIAAKKYAVPYQAHHDSIMSIGIGVYGRGECLVLLA
ncbi:MAG: AAA family ATPase [Deltaproteobacteria bacterium]|jgi:hypothetical protein|nr:AAA family ATPase [Deltaproteobacteria bacterium]